MAIIKQNTAQIITTDGWRRAAGPFSEAINPISLEIPLARREHGRPSLVAVFNPGRNDYRVKLFVDDWDRAPEGLVEVDGHRLLFVQGRLSQPAIARPSGPDLYRLLNGLPPVDDDEGDDAEDDFLDLCIDTPFVPDERSQHLAWRGDHLRCPAWMSARSIEVTPPQTGGGWHNILLRAPGIMPEIRLHGRGIPPIRVNGVWCYAMPLADQIDKNGVVSFGATWTLVCDPRDLDVVRGYGDDDEADEENAPAPVRDRYMVRKVHRIVGLSNAVYNSWMRDIKTWQNSLLGMAGAQGQVDVHADGVKRYKNKVEHYERLVNSAFARRKPAYRSYRKEDWLQEEGGKPYEWSEKIKTIRHAVKNYAEPHDRLAAIVDEQRAKYTKALERLEALDEKYESVVRYLYPASDRQKTA